MSALGAKAGHEVSPIKAGKMRAVTGAPQSAARLRDGKTEAIARCLRRSIADQPARILVVGCGSGLEAAILAQELGAHVTGIDTSVDFDPAHAALATLRQGDAESLEFADKSFDLVYSYHALEHIPRYRVALAEMRRVLAEGGHYCVGTPNRLRLLGYLGSKDASPWQKLLWNANDWSARLRGRFRNEYGAHAGFSPEELGAALGGVFSSVQDITPQYYLEVYAGKAGLVGFLDASGMGRFLYPSVYFIGRR